MAGSTVLAAGTALTVAVFGVSCGAPSQHELSIGDIQQERYFYEGAYLGQQVVVAATVVTVLSPDHFDVIDTRSSAKLSVMTTVPVHVTEGQALHVAGTVGQLHHWAVSDGLPYIQDNLYAARTTEAYLYNASVLPAAR
ncbi:hypothetical protein ACWDKQ_35255 [Saccharopolyspora sp. NPDC000995]